MGKKRDLISKASVNYLLSGLILMLISLLALYFLTEYYIEEDTDEALESTLFRIEKLLEEDQEVPAVYPIIVVEESDTIGPRSIKDTVIFDPAQREEEIFRELSAYKEIRGRTYKIWVRTLVVEAEDIILAILYSYLGILIVLYMAQFYFNRVNAKAIWKPFFENLERIKSFSLQSDEPMALVPTDIKEFAELNEELKILTKKVLSDYKTLKQFTEDVSHEIQSPLAIIQAKIGNLMDENKLGEMQFQLLTEIQQNVHRLAQLNKKLILLAKIDNQQFASHQQLDMLQVLKSSLKNYEDMSVVQITFKSTKELTVCMDPTLAGIMTDNLLSNAVRYTPDEGKIEIKTNAHSLTVANTGKSPLSDPELIFDRFYREEQGQRSLGLGLAIVKKICDVYGFQANYHFSENMHRFTVRFS